MMSGSLSITTLSREIFPTVSMCVITMDQVTINNVAYEQRLTK